MAMPSTAIFSALEEEIRPLVRDWRRKTWKAGANELPAFEGPDCIAVCAGIGGPAAGRAAAAALVEFRPELIISAGFAGALVEQFRVGDMICPAVVVDGATGERFDVGSGKGTLVSSSQVVGPNQKRQLCKRFAAEVVDMESASLAQVARANGVRFMAVKAISDELNFPLPDFSRFIDAAGQLDRGRLGMFSAVRPWLWPRMLRLAANSRRASEELCRALEHLIMTKGNGEQSVAPGTVPEPRSH